uniref:Uncharacterized protein n=1 Tax=viral metagenome TaxID=1070528 RepID=A0A6M3JVX6_9ZZZZ
MKTLTVLIFFAIIGAIYGLGYLSHSMNNFPINNGIAGVIGCLEIGFIVAVIISSSVFILVKILGLIYDILTSAFTEGAEKTATKTSKDNHKKTRFTGP